MTSRERVYRTLEFRQPDRVPRDCWALPWVSMFAREAYESLLSEYPGDFGWAGGVLGPGDRRRGRDCRVGQYTDDWGCVWQCAEDGVIGEVKHAPLADWSALASFRPPWEVLDRADVTQAQRAQERNLAGPQRFLMCGSTVRPFERMQFLRGTEELLIDLAYGSAEVMRLREMVHEFNLREMELWARAAGDGVLFMDDWGSQQALLIAPGMWRELFKPLYRDYCDRIHAGGKKVFFHSDGHISAIYPDLVEIGVDAINSQLFCMDIEELGRQYKGRVTFWGEIDRQHVLPFGSVEDVRRAVGRVRRALADPSGGVIAQCEWGVKCPPENVRAVFQAWEAPLDELA